MALKKLENAGGFRTSQQRGDCRFGERRPQGSAAQDLTTFDQKPRWRKLALRLAGFGLLSIVPLGLLVSPLPQDDANSQPIAPVVTNVFAARWPSENAWLRSAAAKPNNSLFAASSSTGSADARPQQVTQQAAPSPNATAALVQTVSYRPTETAVASQPAPPDSVPLAKSKTELVEFGSAPFPYEGVVPGTDEPFLNVVNGEQKGHRTARGAVLWQEETFNDSHVLLHIPSGFDINRPAVMVVFFHGHGANLTRDVLNRQAVPEQINLSGVNAVLVAPQFAVDAADSSPGRFWQPGAFARFVNEASAKLASINGNPAKAKQFANMPVIIVAYSGGYLPAAWSIRNGGLGKRLHGVVLLDGLYGEIGDFAKWIKNSPSVFFVSAYTSSTRRQNLELANILKEENVPYSTDIGGHLWRGHVALLATDSDVNHRDFVTQAWTSNPIADILANLN